MKALLAACSLSTVATAVEEPGLLPRPGEVEEADDPWDDWEDEPVPITPQREPFRLPPVAELFPQRAIVIPPSHFRSVDFEGYRRFSRKDLEAETAVLLEGPCGPEAMDAVAEAITRRYVEAGFINSGAVVEPDPDDPGRALVRITEGRLDDVLLRGNQHFRDAYLTSRVIGDSSATLHFPTLQQRLQTLQMHPGIERIEAELRPGLRPGESYLDLTVEDRPTHAFGIDFHNQLPPSVGAEQLDLWFQSSNLTGWGDSLDFRYGVFAGGAAEPELAGIDNLSVAYQIPVHPSDTTLTARFTHQGYTVIEEPFNELLISGQSQTWALGLRQPLRRTPGSSLWASLTLGQTHAKTELLGMPFSVAPGFVNGRIDLTTLEAGLEWNLRRERSALRVATELVLGLDALGAEAAAAADANFFLWLARFQYLHQLNPHRHTLVIRGGFQWADGALPSPRQAAVGGLGSVRGFRENELVRDIGTSLGVEYRIPCIRHGRWQLGISPFVDAGFAQDHDGQRRETLLSAGLGIHLSYDDWFRGDLYWGHPLSSRSTSGGDDLQDRGVHFRLTVAHF